MIVLIAEDDDMLRQVVSSQLERLGLKSIAVPCGRRAVEEALSNPVSLILMDLQMPNVDGAEATRQIRAQERRDGRGHVPIVGITAAPAREACIAAGMDDHFQKPLLMTDLERIVRKWRPGGGSRQRPS